MFIYLIAVIIAFLTFILFRSKMSDSDGKTETAYVIEIEVSIETGMPVAYLPTDLRILFFLP